ncbi:hypothetical protein MTO96_016775 [Rhipicephalus appendiculatus]
MISDCLVLFRAQYAVIQSTDLDKRHLECPKLTILFEAPADTTPTVQVAAIFFLAACTDADLLTGRVINGKAIAVHTMASCARGRVPDAVFGAAASVECAVQMAIRARFRDGGGYSFVLAASCPRPMSACCGFRT